MTLVISSREICVSGSKCRSDSSSSPKNSSRTGHGLVGGKNVQNATAQGDFAFLRNLRFRFVTLFFKKFNQVERRDFFTTFERAGAFLDLAGRKSFLQKRGDARHDEF